MEFIDVYNNPNEPNNEIFLTSEEKATVYEKVKIVLNKNMADRHIRGGIATKNKFKTQA